MLKNSEVKLNNFDFSVSILKIIEEYTPLVRSRVALFLKSGIEYDDLMQEGMIGLFNSIKSYDISKSSFSNFAVVCIDRMLIDVCRLQNKKSAIPREMLVNISSNEENIANDIALNPENIFMARENYNDLLDYCKSVLSDMEYTVFYNVLIGYKQSEISNKLGISAKSVDNTLQRVKLKLRRCDKFNMPK